ncbi:MAG: hypothetical protein WC264_00870 [Candidatus Paceibacterota bacterium]|jgi:hypothetical protein
MKEKSFDEVVANWLKDEWHYSNHDKYREYVSEDLILNPNLKNQKENKKRFDLLMSYRSNIISQLPTDTKWYLAKLTKEDIKRTFLIPMTKGWVAQITNKTCCLIDAINKTFWSATNQIDIERIEKIKTKLNDKNVNTRLIFISSSKNSSFTCIEGNHRLIAITAKALENYNSNIILNEIYLGISPKMESCGVFCKNKKITD